MRRFRKFAAMIWGLPKVDAKGAIPADVIERIPFLKLEVDLLSLLQTPVGSFRKTCLAALNIPGK
jgi:hypothetical protein